MKNLLLKLRLFFTGLFRSFNYEQLRSMIVLVTKAQGYYKSGKDKFEWVAAEFQKLYPTFKAWHDDKTPTHALTLIVSVAKEIALNEKLILSK